MRSASPEISWTPPPPRAGVAGAWDRFAGPGQTGAELALGLVPSLLGAVAVAAAMAAAEFAVAEVALGAVLAFDIIGGVVVNATTAGKRWYHRPEASAAELAGFVAIHVVHVALVGLVFLDGDWGFVGVVYGLLVLSMAAVLAAPLYLQRPVAGIGFIAGTAVALGFFPLPPELQWFVPLLFYKLLGSHLTREAPFAS